ncbi:MAG TPA: TolC family protein [Acidobacteriota bacterium]|nr:TolC family protein [Acidobacteriota bacterium]
MANLVRAEKRAESCGLFHRSSTPGWPWLFLFLIGVPLCSSVLAGEDRQEVTDYSRNPEWFPRVYKPYMVRKIPVLELTSSAGISQLIHDGKLQISLSRLVNAVRENNLEILASSNSARYAQTDILRAKGGGAPRGGAGVTIPSSLFAGAIGAGVGGGGGLGSFGSAGISGGARQVSVFPRGSYDPTLLLGFSVDRTRTPLNTIRVSGLPETMTASTALQARYNQAFTSGTSLSVTFNNMRQSSTQLNLLYNPDFLSTLTFSVTQQLLNGFGRAVNGRFMDVARNETTIMQEGVRLQINTTLASSLNIYWDLVAARENVHVAEEALGVAKRLHQENKQREEIGVLSYLDVVTAESEVAARERDLVVARTTLQMREVDLKNAISKQMDASLASAVVEPSDPLPEPKGSDIMKLSDALSQAMKSRPEIHQADANILIQDLAVKYERTLLKPSLVVFGQFASSGLYGNHVITDTAGLGVLLPGGISQALRQVSTWTYPEWSVGFSFSINLRNRAAEADSYRTKLERQQAETSLQRTRNSIALEVRKALIALIQNKAQVEAAHKAVQLSGETLAAEETKLLEGASIPYEVIRRQRDFRSAQLAEVQAHVDYAKALVELDRSMGILDSK